MAFQKLLPEGPLSRAVYDMGFEEPTDVQLRVIPLIREGRDVMAQSQTGTGKTAAFAIPTLEKVDPKLYAAQVLVLCPTRELAVQVAAQYTLLAKYLDDVRALPLYGGEEIRRQIERLKRHPQVIVGTPGRILDHLRRRTLKLEHLHTLVLDEADEMLNMGFREDIEKVLEQIPGETQRLLFSATIPKAIRQLSGEYLVDPALVEVKASGISAAGIRQQVVRVKREHKKDALLRLLELRNPSRALLFCNTKAMVDELSLFLQEKGYSVEAMHGDMKQEQRIRVLQQFNRGGLEILAATDVAARGLDIDDVDLVISYDVPQSPEYYVHRIGRSGRAGKSGESILMFTSRDSAAFRAIEQYIKRGIEPLEIPSLSELDTVRIKRFLKKLKEESPHTDIEEYRPMLKHFEKLALQPEAIIAALLRMGMDLYGEEGKDLNIPKPSQKKHNKQRGRHAPAKGQRKKSRYDRRG